MILQLGKLQCAAMAGLAFTLASLASAADKPTARDRFYEAARAGDEPEWVGARTGILLKRGTGAAASIKEVAEDAEFQSGDQFRIRLQSNVDGFAYLVQLNGKECRVLFPNTGSGRSNKVKAFETRWVPARAGKTWFAFDERPVVEGLHLLVSRKPIAELERGRDKDGKLKVSLFEDLLKRNGETVDMQFDEKPKAGISTVPATYYVEKKGRQFMAREIQLDHQRKPRVE